MKKLSELISGDVVYHDGNSSFCTLSELEVTDIKYKFDEDTGERYKVIICDNMEFDGRTGEALNTPTMYYIEPK